MNMRERMAHSLTVRIRQRFESNGGYFEVWQDDEPLVIQVDGCMDFMELVDVMLDALTANPGDDVINAGAINMLGSSNSDINPIWLNEKAADIFQAMIRAIREGK